MVGVRLRGALLRGFRADGDIATTLLLFAKDAAPQLLPEFEEEKYLAIFREQLRGLRDVLHGTKNPELVVKKINLYFFGTLGLEHDWEGALFLPTLLDTHKGNCAALTSLYFALARGLQLPVWGAYLPGHLIARWDDGEYKINVDLSMRGARIDDEVYEKQYALARAELEQGIYLANLGAREIFAVLLVSRGSIYVREKLYARALDDYKLALTLRPAFAEAHLNMGNVYLKLNRPHAALREYNRALACNPVYGAAREARELAIELIEKGV